MDEGFLPVCKPHPLLLLGKVPGALPLELWGHIINRVHDKIAMERWWLAWRMIELNRNPNITPMGSLELITVKAIFAAENYWLGREQDFWRAHGSLAANSPRWGPPQGAGAQTLTVCPYPCSNIDIAWGQCTILICDFF